MLRWMRVLGGLACLALLGTAPGARAANIISTTLVDVPSRGFYLVGEQIRLQVAMAFDTATLGGAIEFMLPAGAEYQSFAFDDFFPVGDLSKCDGLMGGDFDDCVAEQESFFNFPPEASIFDPFSKTRIAIGDFFGIPSGARPVGLMTLLATAPGDGSVMPGPTTEAPFVRISGATLDVSFEPTEGFSVVPEPGTLLLASAGLLGLAFACRPPSAR